MKRRWFDLALVLGIIAVLGISFYVGSVRQQGAAESFVGSDSTVTTMVEEQGHRQWFTPLFEPGSGEIESGLFAMQAALGAGVLGYCLGRLHARHRSRAATSPTVN